MHQQAEIHQSLQINRPIRPEISVENLLRASICSIFASELAMLPAQAPNFRSDAVDCPGLTQSFEPERRPTRRFLDDSTFGGTSKNKPPASHIAPNDMPSAGYAGYACKLCKTRQACNYKAHLLHPALHMLGKCN